MLKQRTRMPSGLGDALLVGSRTKPIQALVSTYSIILHGRNRHLRVNLFFNRLSNCRASGSTVTHLSSFIKQKFGSTAVGIKVNETIYRNDEEMMRDGAIQSNQTYYIVYADYTPSYSDSVLNPPLYHDASDRLPDYSDEVVKGYLTPAYFEELVYYPVIPLVQKILTLRLKYGRRTTITLTNKETQWQNSFRHELMLKAGYHAHGIIDSNGRNVYSDDDILWNATIPDLSVVDISYTAAAAVPVLTSSSSHPSSHQRVTRPHLLRGSSGIAGGSGPNAGTAATTSSAGASLNRRRMSSNSARSFGSLNRVTSRSSTASHDSRPTVRAK